METQTILVPKISRQKQELIDWISNMNDVSVLDNLTELKRRETFNFEEEFKKGITGEELKRRTTEFLKTLPWKK